MESSDENSSTLNRLVLIYDVFDPIKPIALTMKLDLAILLATVDNCSIGAEHGSISSVVDTFSRDKWNGNKHLLSLFRPGGVSPDNGTDK